MSKNIFLSPDRLSSISLAISFPVWEISDACSEVGVAVRTIVSSTSNRCQGSKGDDFGLKINGSPARTFRMFLQGVPQIWTMH